MNFLCKCLASTLILAMSLGGCAVMPGARALQRDVQPVSSGLACDQHSLAGAEMAARLDQLKTQLEQAQAQDKAVLASGYLLYWPALFPVGGDKQVQAEYGQLQAEQNALKQRMIDSRCVLRP